MSLLAPDFTDQLSRFEFAGVAFPVVRYDMDGFMRAREHEYWKTPSARQEKGGRKAYPITVEPVFNESLNDRFPGLFPGGFRTLIKAFEAGETHDLVIPIYGKITAFCANWKPGFDAMLRNGISMPLRFVEDLQNTFTFDASITASNVASVGLKGDALNKALTDVNLLGANDESLFGKLTSAVNSVRAIRDQAIAYDQLVLSQLEAVLMLASEIDATVTAFADPANATAFDAFQDLWATTLDVANDLKSKRVELQKYVVPKKMTIQEVSTAIYGDTSHAQDLFDMNDIENSFAIQAGTVIAYYPNAVA